MVKIGLLIPTTTYNRNWLSIDQTYILTILLPSLSKILEIEQHTYCVYFGIDKDCQLLDNKNNQYKITTLYPNINFKFITLSEEKGYLSRMWNILFKEAYNDGCDYFYQCGDDIDFNNNNAYFSSLINILKSNNNIGVTGAHDKKRLDILEQSFVSREHMRLFGFYFPEEIRNWFVDDWISCVYAPAHYRPIKGVYVSNIGGKPRYDIKKVNKDEFNQIVNKYKVNL